jgi:hypothetical protein
VDGSSSNIELYQRIGGDSLYLRGEASAIALAPDVVFVDSSDGSARLLNLGGSFYALNVIGAQFLRTALLHDISSATKLLSSSLAVSEEQINADLQLLLYQLSRKTLIRFKNRPSKRIQYRRTLQRLLVSPALFLIRHASASNHQRVHCLLFFSRVCFGLFGWSDTVALWRGHVADDQLSRVSRVRAISDLVRRAGADHWLPVACKEKSISCWKLLQWEGIQSDLVVGVSLSPMQAHCWCSHGHMILADDAERCKMFASIARYDTRQH